MAHRRGRGLALQVAAASILAGCGPSGTPGTAAFEPDSIPEAYAHSSAALLWPLTTRAFQVTPDGDLFNGEWFVRIDPQIDRRRPPPPSRIAYEERWLPAANWTRARDQVTWRFEAVPFPEPPPRDSGLVVSLLVRVANRGGAPRAVALSMILESPRRVPAFVAFDAPETPSPALAWGSRGARDTVYGWAAGAPREPAFSVEWTLGPGESRDVRVLLPAYPTAAASLAKLARRSHEARKADLRRHWTQLLEEGTRFELGDPELEGALRAARVLLLSCRERRGARQVPIGGPFHYRDVWLRDGARLIHALAVAGHTHEARELADGFLLLRWPHGAFLSQRGQPDGTGQALWAFEQAMLRPAPADSLARYVEAGRLAWRWFEWQRKVGRESGWRFGLMLPFADPRDAELVQAQLVGTDAWAIAGYRATSRMMAAAGLQDEAREVDLSRARYVADFEAALSRTRSRDVPPSWQGIGRDWGNLAVGWPCAVLPPSHPRLHALADRVWSMADEPGLVSYGHRDSLHYYVGADLGTWSLVAGRRADAERVLDALLHWRSASGAMGELFSRAGDFGDNLPPHPTSAAALVALTRNSLLFDDGDTLQLTLGARERWWRGAHIARAPTRWGLVDLEFRREGDQARWRWTGVPVWTALTLPPGAVIGGAPAPPLRALGPTVVLAPPGTGEARVALAGMPAAP